MLVHWIWLAEKTGLSNREKVAVVEFFSDPEAAFFASEESYAQVEGLSAQTVAALADKDLKAADAVLLQCSRQKIHICTYGDAAYPARLKGIADPPVVLYYKGVMPDLEGQPVIGVVGTRKCSSYGARTAKQLAHQIVTCGAVVVSGAAKGIDTAAMTGAMDAGGKVVGVLGCGVDVVYPAGARQLYERVQESGCLISEYVPGTTPAKWNFPRRNRIISALSCGVLVVEALENSGALITARQAVEQGRDVFAVPGNIDLPGFAGSNALLREGAIAVGNGWDVVGEYQDRYPDKVHKQLQIDDQMLRFWENQEPKTPKVAEKPRFPGEKKTFDSKKEKITVDNQDSGAYSDEDSAYKPASREEAVVLEKMGNDVWQVDALLSSVALPAEQVLRLLTLLEIKGIVSRVPGGQIRKNKP